ncbi:MAG: hypothetical protein AW08_02921 [Candidatus Accumulibacter adjunctus]|uniref:Uncharacterized protein n=1 Tax=Candidatus Accumulibacter adjunctus TaxID=1454001 RepID=A0A011MT12_9PROT|nr:MAG: hypothetical protein AW08_02921 [Candidatus Accumulibacter adjunctus]
MGCGQGARLLCRLRSHDAARYADARSLAISGYARATPPVPCRSPRAHHLRAGLVDAVFSHPSAAAREALQTARPAGTAARSRPERASMLAAQPARSRPPDCRRAKPTGRRRCFSAARVVGCSSGAASLRAGFSRRRTAARGQAVTQSARVPALCSPSRRVRRAMQSGCLPARPRYGRPSASRRRQSGARDAGRIRV